MLVPAVPAVPAVPVLFQRRLRIQHVWLWYCSYHAFAAEQLQITPVDSAPLRRPESLRFVLKSRRPLQLPPIEDSDQCSHGRLQTARPQSIRHHVAKTGVQLLAVSTKRSSFDALMVRLPRGDTEKRRLSVH